MSFIKKHKWLSGIIVLILILSMTTFLLLRNPPDFLLKFIIEAGIGMQEGSDHIDEDGLYVITTGTGAPLPEAGRVGPQTVIVAGDETLVFDAGPGSTLNFELARLDVSSVDALFITHYHSDHIGDIGELMLKRWASNVATGPLPIYGPVGIGLMSI